MSGVRNTQIVEMKSLSLPPSLERSVCSWHVYSSGFQGLVSWLIKNSKETSQAYIEVQSVLPTNHISVHVMYTSYKFLGAFLKKYWAFGAYGDLS